MDRLKHWSKDRKDPMDPPAARAAKAAVSLLLALALSVGLAACKKDEGGEAPPGSTVGTTAVPQSEPSAPADPAAKIDDSYRIVRSEASGNAVQNAALTLRSAYRGEGIFLTVCTDSDADGAQVSEREILIGDTNRPESRKVRESLAEGERWKVSLEGEKLVIAGISDYALTQAVNHLVNDCINKGNGVNFMSQFTLSETDNPDSLYRFDWKDGEETLISGASWAPRVYTLKDGTFLAGVETHNGIQILFSDDNGKSWTPGKIASFYPTLACANVNFYEFEGKLYLSYRAVGAAENGSYTSLQVSVSQDGGKSWKKHSTVYENTPEPGGGGGVWEPCLGEMNGKLTCFYANDATPYPMQYIEYKVWDGSEWGSRTVVSDGIKHDSRDGMPVWTKLSSGEYVCVIESSHLRSADEPHPFVIQLLWSKDGINWSEPVDIYYPTTVNSKAAAPGIIELPNGQLVVSLQTDEDATQKGDPTSVMKTIISDGTPVQEITAKNFTPSDNIFGTPDGKGSTWTGIWYHDGFLYAAAGTDKGSSLKTIDLR